MHKNKKEVNEKTLYNYFTLFIYLLADFAFWDQIKLSIHVKKNVSIFMNAIILEKLSLIVSSYEFYNVLFRQ